MSLFKIAWRSIQHRGFGSALSILSMALGVMLLVAVLCAHSIISRSFQKSRSFGYGAIVGARGGNLQLTMNTVFYLDRPTGNIPYEYFLEFKDLEYRQARLEKSIARNQLDAVAANRELALGMQASAGGGLSALAGHWQQRVEEQQWTHRAELDKGTMLATFTKMAIPLALGDYWSPAAQEDWSEDMVKYRVVGTTPGIFL